MLRCEKTGKLFFTTKEAELHGEETGFKDFSQVSLEEKIWICAETKKVCFNEQQMDIHKKRVPEAVTWEEKTVADLKAEQDKKATASSSDVTDMETEEDVLLRAAGKAPKGKGKAGALAGPPVVTKETVDQLIEMGFTELRAQKALVKTSNAGIEGAINWLTEHLEDADIDDPLPEEGVVMKTAEEIGQATAEGLAGTSGLSAEEKKAKLEEMLAKARAKKAGISVEEQKQLERQRREGGQALVKSKRELEEAQRKRDMEARKREKREFELERQRLREKLAADKAAKQADGTLVSAVKNAAASAQLSEAAAEERERLAKAKAEMEAKNAAPPKPKTEREIEAENALLARAGVRRSYEVDSLSLEDATEKLAKQSDTKTKPALELMQKMMANIAKAPSEPKYRKMRLSNPKVAEGLVHVLGAREYLKAIGWQIVETEFLELPMEGDGAAQAQRVVAQVEALVQSCAAAHRARIQADLDQRKKEAAEKAAKAKAEKEALKAAMARDRAEVAARGPSQSSVARKLGDGGSQTSAIFQEQEEAEGRRNAQ